MWQGRGHIFLRLIAIKYHLKLQSIAIAFYKNHDQYCYGKEYVTLIFDIRRPFFHLPLIKHDFAEQLISYQLTAMLNENGSTRFSSKVFTHSFSGFSYYLKNVIIDRYIMNCNVINCVSCERVANHQAHLNCN